MLRGRGRPGRDDAGAAAGPGRGRGDRAREARRLPAGLPRGHRAPHHPGPARRPGAGRAVRRAAAEPGRRGRDPGRAGRCAADREHVPAAPGRGSSPLRRARPAVGPAEPARRGRRRRARLPPAARHPGHVAGPGERSGRRRPVRDDDRARRGDHRRDPGRPHRRLRRQALGPARRVRPARDRVRRPVRHLVVPAAAAPRGAAGHLAPADREGALRGGDPARGLLPDRLPRPQGQRRAAARRGRRGVPGPTSPT